MSVSINNYDTTYQTNREEKEMHFHMFTELKSWYGIHVSIHVDVWHWKQFCQCFLWWIERLLASIPSRYFFLGRELLLYICTQITDGYHTVLVERESLCQRSTCLQLLNMLSLFLNNECNTVNRESYTKIIRKLSSEKTLI